MRCYDRQDVEEAGVSDDDTFAAMDRAYREIKYSGKPTGDERIYTSETGWVKVPEFMAWRARKLMHEDLARQRASDLAKWVNPAPESPR